MHVGELFEIYNRIEICISGSCYGTNVYVFQFRLKCISIQMSNLVLNPAHKGTRDKQRTRHQTKFIDYYYYYFHLLPLSVFIYHAIMCLGECVVVLFFLCVLTKHLLKHSSQKLCMKC